MKGYEAPETAGTVSTREKEREVNQSVDIPKTVEFDCLCCSVDRFRFVQTLEVEGRVYVRRECEGCGAINDRQREHLNAATPADVRRAVETVERGESR